MRFGRGVVGLSAVLAAWAAFSATYRRTLQAPFAHQDAKAELKKPVPDDVGEAVVMACGPSAPGLAIPSRDDHQCVFLTDG